MDTSQLIEDSKSCIVKIGVVVVENNNPKFIGSGSGFIISNDGYIITCSHVIRNLQVIHVGFDKGNFQLEYNLAKIIHDDKDKDFAILKIEKQNLNFLKLGEFDSNKIGDEVLFFGFPLQVVKVTAHKAMISALGQDILPGVNMNIFQIDGSVNNGNSGGPVINRDGAIIGIITSKYLEFNEQLEKILRLGKMTGISIGNQQGSIDVGESFFNIVNLMRSHINVGIGHAFSIEYAKAKFEEIKATESIKS